MSLSCRKIGNVPDYCLRRIASPKKQDKKKRDIPEQGILNFVWVNQQVTNERKDINELKNMNLKIYTKKRKLFKVG
jgi:hypothetical protein